MRIRLQVVLFALAVSPGGCGSDDGNGGSGAGKQYCVDTCERFKLCIPNLKDSPTQIWVCRCEEDEALWSASGACIAACASTSSCDDLWAYFRHTLTGSAHLYLTDFHACQAACK